MPPTASDPLGLWDPELARLPAGIEEGRIRAWASVVPATWSPWATAGAILLRGLGVAWPTGAADLASVASAPELDAALARRTGYRRWTGPWAAAEDSVLGSLVARTPCVATLRMGECEAPAVLFRADYDQAGTVLWCLTPPAGLVAVRWQDAASVISRLVILAQEPSADDRAGDAGLSSAD